MESITCELRNPLACNAFLACYNVWKQKLWFSGVVRRYKMGTLSKNWLKCDAKSKKCNCKMQNVLISKLFSRSGSVALVQMNPSLKWDHKVFFSFLFLKCNRDFSRWLVLPLSLNVFYTRFLLYLSQWLSQKMSPTKRIVIYIVHFFEERLC